MLCILSKKLICLVLLKNYLSKRYKIDDRIDRTLQNSKSINLDIQCSCFARQNSYEAELLNSNAGNSYRAELLNRNADNSYRAELLNSNTGNSYRVELLELLNSNMHITPMKQSCKTAMQITAAEQSYLSCYTTINAANIYRSELFELLDSNAGNSYRTKLLDMLLNRFCAIFAFKLVFFCNLCSTENLAQYIKANVYKLYLLIWQSNAHMIIEFYFI